MKSFLPESKQATQLYYIVVDIRRLAIIFTILHYNKIIYIYSTCSLSLVIDFSVSVTVWSQISCKQKKNTIK